MPIAIDISTCDATPLALRVTCQGLAHELWLALSQAGHKYSRGTRCLRGGIPIQLLHSVKNRFTVSVEGVLKFGIVVDDLVKEPGRVVVDNVIFVL